MSCRSSNYRFLIFLLPGVAAAASSEEELFFKGVSEVNEGKLVFLAQAPDRPIHHHHNRIFISDDSLATGWVRLEQCHRNLDPVPSLQVVYGQDRIRDIVVLSSAHIGKAWVQANTVQMENLEPGATICIQAHSRALKAEGEGHFSLVNGPYMRHFLDGYYPMRVSLDVTLETEKLRFEAVSPAPQTGFQFRDHGAELGYEALFEGQLRTTIRFSRTP